MPNKPREMSLEDRLFASVRILRRKMLVRSPISNGRLSPFRAISNVLGAEKVPTVRTARQVGTMGLKTRRTAKRKPVRFDGVPQNPKFLAFIRANSCILIGSLDPMGDLHVCDGEIEAAHTGPHGRGQKAADETALPMCSSAHQTGKYAHHKIGRKFWDAWLLNREVLVAKHNRLFEESK